MKIKWKSLIICILIPLFVGGLSSFLTRSGTQEIKLLNKPPLYPPDIIFPIVWTVLYVLMGISSYIICTSENPQKTKALKTYAIQLVFNFLWTLIFFNMQAYLLAFFWIIALWIIIIAMIRQFRKINAAAAYLQIPYLLWVTFAAYLNFGIYWLN